MSAILYHLLWNPSSWMSCFEIRHLGSAVSESILDQLFWNPPLGSAVLMSAVLYQLPEICLLDLEIRQIGSAVRMSAILYNLFWNPPSWMSCFEICHLGSGVEESSMLDQPFSGKLQFWDHLSWTVLDHLFWRHKFNLDRVFWGPSILNQLVWNLPSWIMQLFEVYTSWRSFWDFPCRLNMLAFFPPFWISCCWGLCHLRSSARVPWLSTNFLDFFAGFDSLQGPLCPSLDKLFGVASWLK